MGVFQCPADPADDKGPEFDRQQQSGLDMVAVYRAQIQPLDILHDNQVQPRPAGTFLGIDPAHLVGSLHGMGDPHADARQALAADASVIKFIVRDETT